MIIIHKDTDISDYVSDFSWGGSKSEVARKLELKILNAPEDKNITPVILNLGDMVYLFEDDGITERFEGFVTAREANSATGVVTYTAYDVLYYTTKSTATYNFKGKTAETIAKMVCNDMEIPIGELATTGISQKLIVQGKSIYEIIMQAYTQAYQSNGRQYHVTSRGGKLNVEEMGKVICEIELTDDTNITSSNFKEDLEGVINRVKIYDGEGNPAGVVENEEDRRSFGTFQTTYTKEDGKDANTVAKSMLKGVNSTFTLSGLNYNEVVTGAGVIVKDTTTGLSGIVWVDSDTHTWSNGVATMSLTVTLKLLMDVKESDSTSSKGKSSGGTSSGGAGSHIFGSTSNPPFEVVNADGMLQQGHFTTFAEAYSYYSQNSGMDKGWKILDMGGEVVYRYDVK